MKIPGLGDMGGMMKAMRDMQDKMARDEAELNAMIITGESGAGMVKIKMNGRKECLGVDIDPSVLTEEKTFLEDLIAAAFNDAAHKADKVRAEKTSDLTAGLNIPGGLGGLTSLLK